MPVNLELATAGLGSRGSPPWAAPTAIISMCGEGGLDGGSPFGKERVGGHMVTWGSYPGHT